MCASAFWRRGEHDSDVWLHHDYRFPISWISHDDVIKWKLFPHNWPFVRGIYRSPVNSPHKSQWRGASMFSLICAWINGWVNNREAGNLRRRRAHYDVIVMFFFRYISIQAAKKIRHASLHDTDELPSGRYSRRLSRRLFPLRRGYTRQTTSGAMQSNRIMLGLSYK